MPRLALYLLGPPRIELDDEVVHIGRRKAVALLAYLAVERREHSRDGLATLLWPDYDQSSARADLRRTLSVLNRSLGGEWFASDRDTVGLQREESGMWLDVEAFRGRLERCESHGHPLEEGCEECKALLTEAVGLYGDDFMSGFALPDSLAYEEWQRYQTRGLRDELGSALERLAACQSALGEVEAAIATARRWVNLDPTCEAAHRRLMRIYAGAGREGAALRQYRECIRVLETELGVEPAAETTALYEQIRAQRERVVAPAASAPAPVQPTLPAFLSAAVEPVALEPAVFVARERELALLHGHLERALAGQGCVAFVTGGPGRGKTALLRQFAAGALVAHEDLLVASGNCNAASGVGDPYLPFREALGMLTGDVESRWAAGTISGTHARRLWAAVPLVAQALLDHGPHLIDSLAPGAALLVRARAAASDDGEWLGQLQAWVERERSGHSDLEQRALFTQFANTLCSLAGRRPLLLLLDDLQWADSGSVGMLFHLGRCLADAGGRLLVLGAYRPEEVAYEREGTPHPLEKVLGEFRRRFGDVWVDLAQADQTQGRRFVEAFLDTEPNRLGERFRVALSQRTGGHALFTIELLRSMQDKGDLVQDKEGRWTEGLALDWEVLPARVEAVVKARVDRLDQGQRDLLAAASVEGEVFTAQALAQVQGLPEREVLRVLSRELGSQGHRLVRQAGEERVAGARRFLSRYQFAHALFQSYLYHDLSPGERRLLHHETATALEGLYGAQADEVVVPLAHHYYEAGQTEGAILYALRAGDKAYHAYANEQAVGYFQRVLELLPPAGGDERAFVGRFFGLGEKRGETGFLLKSTGKQTFDLAGRKPCLATVDYRSGAQNCQIACRT